VNEPPRGQGLPSEGNHTESGSLKAPSSEARTTRAWKIGASGSDAESRYVSRASDEYVAPPSLDDQPSESVHDAGEPELVFVVKRGGLISSVSLPEAYDSSGNPVGRSFVEFVASEHKAVAFGSVENVFESGQPDAFEFCGNPPFVTGAWYHCRVLPNHTKSGVISATIIARDITQPKQGDADLEAEIARLSEQNAALQSERLSMEAMLVERDDSAQELEMFRGILDQAGEAIFFIDPETGRFVDANETACRWLNIERDKLLTKHTSDLDLDFPLEIPDGFSEHVTNTRGTKRPLVFNDGSHRRQNGTSFPVEVALSLRSFGDKEYLLAVARDLKQRRSTEQAVRENEGKYENLLDLSHDAVYCSGRDGRVTAVNDTAIELFGFSRDEFLGMDARNLFCNAESITELQQGIEETGSAKNLKVEFLTKLGQVFSGSVAASVTSDGDGNILGYQCAIAPLLGLDPHRDAGRNRALEETREREQAEEQASARWEAYARDLEEKLAKVQSDYAEAKSATEQATLEATGAKLAARDAQKRLQAHAEALQRVRSDLKRAEAEASKARDFAEKAGSAATKLKQIARKAKRKATAMATEVEQARAEKMKAEEEARSAKSRTESVSRELERSETRLGAAIRDAETATTEAAAARREAEEAKAEAEEARRKSAQATKQIELSRTEAATAKSQVDQAILDAERAWAEVENAERKTEARKMIVDSGADNPKQLSSGRDKPVYIERHDVSENLLHSESSNSESVPVVKRRRRKKPRFVSERGKIVRSWLLLAAVTVSLSAVGLIAVSGSENESENPDAGFGDSAAGIETDQSSRGMLPLPTTDTPLLIPDSSDSASTQSEPATD